jgi:chromosome segregation ATPase
MWPRLLAQLLEVLPHISRLIPMADRYFSERSAREQDRGQGRGHAQETTLTALAESVRGDLAGLNQSQSSLGAQLATQSTQLVRVSEQLDHSHRVIAAQAAQLEAATRQLKRLSTWILSSSILVVLLLLSILALLLRSEMTHPS